MSNTKEKISLRAKYDQKQKQLSELMDFIDGNDELPDAVIDALSVHQDVLTHDIAAIRERIMQIEGVD